MTVEELIAHLKHQAKFSEYTTKQMGIPISDRYACRVAGYEQAIIDAEQAVISHGRGECVLCPEAR